MNNLLSVLTAICCYTYIYTVNHPHLPFDHWIQECTDLDLETLYSATPDTADFSNTQPHHGEAEAQPLPTEEARIRYADTDYSITSINQLLGRLVCIPQKAMEENISGNVVLSICISEDDQLNTIRVERSPDQILTDAVVEALNKISYRHAVKNGRYHAKSYLIIVMFRYQ